MSLADDIKYRALELGFDAVGITDAAPIGIEHSEHLARWLQAGYAAGMTYMHRNLDKRIEPARLLRRARSVIVVALNYKPALPNADTGGTAAPLGRVARYAQYEDYHLFIKRRLRDLAKFISATTQRNVRSRICVDSAPLAERALAQRAGLGFIGRNHMLISPLHGPELFIAELVTTLTVQPDEPAAASCEGCNRCLRACPTGALRADGQFDAGRCISYLTIEHKGQIPAEYTQHIADRLFGCDECVLVCPYQQNAPACANTEIRFYPDRARLELNEVLGLGPRSFSTQFADSAIRRLGLERLKRNAQVCLANAARPRPDRP